MNRLMKKRILIATGAVLALSAIAAPQLKQVIKVVGVTAAVEKFGPDINKAINKLAGHTDSDTQFTRVVPIITVGLGKSSAIGAAQVTGVKSKVMTVKAVAQPETDLFGKEIRIRAMIPVSSTDVNKGIKKVEGVGISGIVDLKL